MKGHFIFCFALIVCMGEALAGHAAPAGYVLQWSDEFTNNTLNTNYWNYADPGWRNSAYNIPSAVSVTNGFLVITTYTEGGTNFTGFIDTRDKIANSHGYYEARIRFSNAPGNWSAFWLQSSRMNNDHTNSDPANGAEVDIFEHRFVDEHGNPWVDGGDSAVHWNGYGQAAQTSFWISTNLGVANGFHTYGLLWTSNRYTFYVDDNITWTTNSFVSSTPEFIRLTSEVESNSWAGKEPGGGYSTLADSRSQMLVDYVRYYAPMVPMLESKANVK